MQRPWSRSRPRNRSSSSPAHLAAELDEVSQGILLCPGCASEDAFGEFDAGVAD